MKWLKQNYTIILLVMGEIGSFGWTTFSLVLDIREVTPMFDWRYSALAGFFIFSILIGVHIFSLKKTTLPQIGYFI